jgi:DNA-binding Lrp family transcriptional regulator
MSYYYLVSMDELDRKILDIMNTNARKSFRQMAKQLKVSMSTVSNRVKGLERDGVIKGYIPVLDPHKVGLDLLVIIGVRISKGDLIDVQNEISRHASVYGVYDITGEWDSIVIARFGNREELNTFIKRVHSIEKIERTNTQIVLNVVKEELMVPVPRFP